MNKARLLLLFVFLSSLALVTAVTASPEGAAPATAKQVAAPPADMAALQLPDPAAVGTRSRVAMIPVHLQESKTGWSWNGEAAIDSAEGVSFALMSPNSDAWSIALEINGRSTDLNELAAQEKATLGSGNQVFEGALYRLQGMTPGTYRVSIDAPNRAAAVADAPDGYLIVSSESPYRAYAHLTTHDLLTGRQIGLNAYAYNADKNGAEGAPDAVNGIVETAVAQITTPSGEKFEAAMFDDGLHNDGLANDGVFGMSINAAKAGNYSAHITLSGAEGKRPFVRTSDHVFPVIEPSVTLLSRLPQTTLIDDTDLAINLFATVNAEKVGDVHVAAEVWGHNGRQMAPVAWISAIVEPVVENGIATLPLTLDGRWLALANVDSRLELRNIRVQDAATYIPMTQLDQLPLRAARLPAAAAKSVTAVSDDMLMGTRPERNTKSLNYVGGAKLMLVHGYCSSAVWSGSGFSGYTIFQDYGQNRTHDDFAQRIDTFGDQYDSFGIVAHSQGGAAALHLYTNYWSGLDYSSGSRLIQSVGTPYQGTALAGNLAALGEVFGAGCGTNWDLTYDGASLWLSNIPSWARDDVYYHTTSFTDKWWRYDYCHVATDLFLDDPDDGTTEKWAGQLSGGHNMGHKTGWCHTQSMRDPGQTTDYSRNSNMNAYGNR